MPTAIDYYIAADGTIYYFDEPEVKFLMSIQGTGMPPINYVTQQGPFQHGSTLLDYRLGERVVQLLVRGSFRSQSGVFTGRMQLIDAIRPNRHPTCLVGPGALVHRFPDGSKLYLDVIIEQGPNFEPRKLDSWDEWGYNEVLRFRAHNPVFYNPVQQTHNFINVASDPELPDEPDPNITELVFPITFPISFHRRIGTSGGGGSGDEDEVNTITYQGTWKEFPTIRLLGPLSSPFTIRNTGTDEYIRLNYAVQPDEEVFFDLRYGSKVVVRDDGASLMQYLDPISDLASFHLEPGQNIFEVNILGANSSSQVQMLYKNRYIGY